MIDTVITELARTTREAVRMQSIFRSALDEGAKDKVWFVKYAEDYHIALLNMVRAAIDELDRYAVRMNPETESCIVEQTKEELPF